MPDFLIELRSEEIPARMQARAEADLARLFAEQLAATGLAAQAIETFATPRRLALIARDLPAETAAVSDELKGPRANAPPQALDGFLRKTGLTRDQLVERDGVLFATIAKPGRATAAVLAEAIPAIVRAFPWPKSMRWGAASISTESPRWVRPLQGIVALLGEEIVDFEIAGIRSGAATLGHRFHHPGPITIGGAHDYAEKLRLCHVIVDAEERRQIIQDGAKAAAAAAGLTLIADDGLIAENAGLTEWPVALLGRFDPAFLEVPREVIQLTMRTNQKYFALQSSPARGGGPPPQAVVEGSHPSTDAAGGGVGPLHQPTAGPPPRAGEDFQLAPAFIAIANIEASDGGAAIVAGNQRVLSARLADARFFWEQDLKVPLADQAAELSQIVFHEKLGTLADKVERVAKLARWLVDEGIVESSPERGGGPAQLVEGSHPSTNTARGQVGPVHHAAHGPPPRAGEDDLATLAETAARLCKADLVTQMVGEFPELQGIIGGHLAERQGLPAEIAAAIRDHYKHVLSAVEGPVGQGDEVPTAPVTAAVSLADKLDTLAAFFLIDERPTGSKDPYALRRAALSAIQIIISNQLRPPLVRVFDALWQPLATSLAAAERRKQDKAAKQTREQGGYSGFAMKLFGQALERRDGFSDQHDRNSFILLDFFADRLKVQQREAGVRHDLIDAVFALGGEDDLVRLLARVKALQAFVETAEGADLLAGYKRAANILKKEGWGQTPSPVQGEGQAREASQGEGTLGGQDRALTLPLGSAERAPPSPLQGEGQKPLSYTPETAETALIAALDSAEPRAAAAIEAEDFEGAMAALATLRAPVDAFFDKVTVNDPNDDKRAARLGLLLRMRHAVHRVADFSKIEG